MRLGGSVTLPMKISWRRRFDHDRSDASVPLRFVRPHRVDQCRLTVFELLLQFIPFLACHFQVKHQVLDVQAKLRQGFLNQ